MANEVDVKRPSFSESLTTELVNVKDALPADFNIPRFVQNSLALLNGNDTLVKFNRQYGSSQIKAGLVRAAYLGLDALNAECYLVPYGSTLNLMPSYKGSIKMAKKYATRPIKDIYARVVREGDIFEEAIVNGEPSINFHPKPFSNAKIIGAFAVCLYEDGGQMCESMSIEEIEVSRGQSKQKNAIPWNKFYGEMVKKTILHRLCKHISIDMDAKEWSSWNEGLEIETDQRELAKREIEQGENSEDFIEVESEVVTS